MTWYIWKRWRIAYVGNANPLNDCHSNVDQDGVWVPVGLGFFWLRTRAPL